MTLCPLSARRLAGAALLALAAPAAWAQAFDAVRLYGAAPGQDGGLVGAAVIAAREYAGSDQRRTLLVPVLDYQWANGWFAGFTNGVGYNFSKSPQLQYGLRLTADTGRKAHRSDALRGMGDIDPALEGGAFFNYLTPQGWFATTSLRYGAGNDHDGLVIDLGAGHSIALAPRWRLAAGAALTLANSAYLQSFFGVNGPQASASGYSAHDTRGGLRDVRANLSLSYSFSARTSLTTALSVSSLQGDAKDSPLVHQRTSTAAVLALGYTF